ncbi:protein phosphatase 1 regulatory subunit 7-like [Asterias rubens]|uniref:protein phosphatase 1 regulatory subunit 7-like n=1 Tax=Asterias rubens TaxID=7604 RepID=UPI001455A06F|nr:protein phosphatase 1 regulatory subunit 7-like [Asterias rubens]
MTTLQAEKLSTNSRVKSTSSKTHQASRSRHGKLSPAASPSSGSASGEGRPRNSAPSRRQQITNSPSLTKVAGRRGGSSGSNVVNHRRRLNGEDKELEDSGQDVRFTDVPSQEDSSARPSSNSQLSPQDILKLSQEGSFEDVYEVNLHASNVGTVPNLEKFTNLRLLDLSCNSIKQVKNLHQNKGLRELKLYGNQITEVINLENLVELHTLQLQHNRINNLGRCLSCLKKLKVLRLDSNHLRKLESREIASCSQLTFLDISSNRIDNLTGLNCLSTLEELHATHNDLKSVGELSRCKKLNEVNFSYNRLSDVTGLKGLPHITILHLSHNVLTTNCLKALGRLRSLQNLDISSNQLIEVNVIPELFPALEVLNASENRIHRWSSVLSLAKCTSLSELYMSGNPFCMEDGEKPSYHHDLQEHIPHLDILDGAHVKKTSSKTVPIMRPMSAASAVSARQVENQLKSVEQDLLSFESSLQARFESMRSTMETLPLEAPPRPSTALSIRSISTSDGSRPASRCNSRSRIAEAQAFAFKNF